MYMCIYSYSDIYIYIYIKLSIYEYISVYIYTYTYTYLPLCIHTVTFVELLRAPGILALGMDVDGRSRLICRYVRPQMLGGSQRWGAGNGNYILYMVYIYIYHM